MDLAQISQEIANKITEDLNYSEDNKEIVAYAIETGLLNILGMTLIIFLGLLLNAPGPTILAALFGGTLRRLSGGAHFDTPLKCLIFGAIGYSAVGLLAKNLALMGFTSFTFTTIVLFVSLLLVLGLAPVDSQAKPIHSRSLRKKLKISSVAFVVATFIAINVVNDSFFITSATLGLFFQSITLLPIFNRRRWIQL
ncbi:accessory gene regulator ArgB-like protein [Desulfitobacterium sp. Sab5]|uniref:accessory gene regulator ArgB-like protein n=1 Tax=Desulfitobacterium nosdiversum TaxID=3375356 RepID=UPI003CF9F015